jgi:cobalt-precorrin 5A hydrolase
MSHVIAGIGFRRGTSAEDIVSLLRRACAQAGRTAAALATPTEKAEEPGLREAAKLLALPLIPVSPDALAEAQPRCITPSVRALQAMGVASVAEGSALAAAGPRGKLLLARIASATATCALAETP